MTPHANRILRRLHVVAAFLSGAAIFGVLFDRPRVAAGAIIPVLFLILISLEALRVAAAKSEKR